MIERPIPAQATTHSGFILWAQPVISSTEVPLGEQSVYLVYYRGVGKGSLTGVRATPPHPAQTAASLQSQLMVMTNSRELHHGLSPSGNLLSTSDSPSSPGARAAGGAARISDGQNPRWGSQGPPPNSIHNGVLIFPWPSPWTTDLLPLCGSALALLLAKVISSLRWWWDDQIMLGKKQTHHNILHYPDAIRNTAAASDGDKK